MIIKSFVFKAIIRSVRKLARKKKIFSLGVKMFTINIKCHNELKKNLEKTTGKIIHGKYITFATRKICASVNND